ncbi:MAG: transglycosylase domain-containing protein [Zetaproteobacteria bacterium]|nr:transglycosylase domain-containing protein [Zetaproteobacteria bacterium]
MKFIHKLTRWLLYLMIFGASMSLGLGAAVAWLVFHGDRSELAQSTLLSKINEETTIFYLDEKTRLGSLFESRHRKYVGIDEVPAHMINAVIAAEDKSFYDHFGIDPLAVGKAFAEGLLNGGRFRRGGSTITQQTVKNIVGDWEASFSRKFREMIKAIQLEQIYTKRQVLEFYLNQFHVSGNGNGIGIAARYYFNKEVQDLSLVEAAFIAGSLKGPGKYNPFIKYSQPGREAAKAHAFERKNYVLGRMYEQGWISEADYIDASSQHVPFNRGEFRTAEVALVNLIRSQLSKQEVLEALGVESVDDLNVAGMKVFTTLDAELQNAAQLAMRKNLSRLETILSGYQPEDPSKYKVLRDVKQDDFVYVKVMQVLGTGIEDFRLTVSMGVPEGEIPTASIIRYAKLLDLPIGKGYDQVAKELFAKIQPGDILYAQVKEYDREKNHVTLELQKRPEISGGMIAIDRGEVRAVVSGFDTLGYNRAMHAKRQPGSLFKALIFFSALQLGWSMLDTIDNDRTVFVHQGKFYFPRPDHRSPYDQTSILWSGVMSENLASVSIGSRLLEKADFEQFKQVLSSLDLLPRADETPTDYHYRVEKKIGVSLDHDGIKSHLLRVAADEIATDLIFDNDMETLKRLRKLWWGNGYLAETVAIRQLDPEDYTLREKHIRLRLLLNNHKRMLAQSKELQSVWQGLQTRIATEGFESVWSDPIAQEFFDDFRILSTSRARPEVGYFPVLESEAEFVEVEDIRLETPPGRKLNYLDAMAIWGDPYQELQLRWEDVKLGGYLSAHIVRQLDERVENMYTELINNRSKFLLERYYNHHDFRISLGLNYTVELSHQGGVYSPLEPVLSFPLGSNDVTASEVAKLYQTFISGKTYRFYRKGPLNQINFVRRIEDRNGNILFQAQSETHQLVDPEITHQMKEILRRTVTHGTGRRARGELYVELPPSLNEENNVPIRVPAFGKTGTTNDYQTSYFAGFLPYPTSLGAPLNPENSYVISAYVGYDNNRVMRNGRQRIYGGSGALPMWTDFAKEIIHKKDYHSFLDPLDLNLHSRKEWPLDYNDHDLSQQLVDLPRGVVLRSARSSDVESWKTTNIGSTGESYQDLFAPGTSVQTVLQLPPSLQQAGAHTSGLFSPFTPQREDSPPLFLEDTLTDPLEGTVHDSIDVSIHP